MIPSTNLMTRAAGWPDDIGMIDFIWGQGGRGSRGRASGGTGALAARARNDEAAN